MRSTLQRPALLRQSPAPTTPQSTPPSREKLLNAALHIFRVKGYTATTVDDICRKAGLTKGSFFHHFKSKDDLALAAVAHWRSITEDLFASAPYHEPQNPLDRLLGYLDFRDAILQGDLPNYTCLLGTLVQETYDTHPGIRSACDLALNSHIAELTRDVQAAKDHYAPRAAWSADSVGSLIQAVLQGSFIFAKARQSPKMVRENLDHLRHYLRYLLHSTPQTEVISRVHSEEETEHDDPQSHFTD